MARLARAVARGCPHYITQRGNRDQPVFFRKEDYQHYMELLAESCGRNGVEIWAYCLLPNKMHLIAVPDSDEGLRLALGSTHQVYTRMINERHDWQGHLWQGRFSSFPMEETYLLDSARYVERAPVRARLCRRPEKYPWSSVAAHLAKKDDILVRVAPLLELMPRWRTFIAADPPEAIVKELRSKASTGRPLGSLEFISRLEQQLGRQLRPQKRGPKPKTAKAIKAAKEKARVISRPKPGSAPRKRARRSVRA